MCLIWYIGIEFVYLFVLIVNSKPHTIIIVIVIIIYKRCHYYHSIDFKTFTNNKNHIIFIDTTTVSSHWTQIGIVLFVHSKKVATTPRRTDDPMRIWLDCSTLSLLMRFSGCRSQTMCRMPPTVHSLISWTISILAKLTRLVRLVYNQEITPKNHNMK